MRTFHVFLYTRNVSPIIYNSKNLTPNLLELHRHRYVWFSYLYANCVPFHCIRNACVWSLWTTACLCIFAITAVKKLDRMVGVCGCVYRQRNTPWRMLYEVPAQRDSRTITIITLFHQLMQYPVWVIVWMGLGSGVCVWFFKNVFAALYLRALLEYTKLTSF